MEKENWLSLMEGKKQKEAPLHRTRAKPFKGRASFRRIETIDCTLRMLQRGKFKKTWMRREAEGNIESDTLCMQGYLKKGRHTLARAPVALGDR